MPDGIPKPSETAVLLAEDDESRLRISAHVLEMAGYRVAALPESESALRWAREHRAEPIHLLLTDVRMDPHMSGARLAHLLRAERPGLRVVYMSAFPASDIVLREAATGQALLIKKPFTPTVLLDSVRRALAVAPVEA